MASDDQLPRGLLSIDVIDNLTIGKGSDLSPAYEALLERWRTGLRDRETGLRLLFLAWYAWAEPQELTGLPDKTGSVATEVFDSFGGSDSDDPEFLFVASHMLSNWAWGFVGASERRWVKRGRACRAKAKRMGVSDLPPELFAGRGEYGRYFEHIAAGGVFRCMTSSPESS